MDFFEKSFDYVIVGGGTAGLAVAARLSEDPHVQVGVIEAGPSALNGEDAGAITIPGRYGEAIGSKYDWQFETIPQKGLINRSIPWPRGRVLGGTSALNFMAWNRGHYRDYDSWASLGNNGWDFEHLLYAMSYNHPWVGEKRRDRLTISTDPIFSGARHSTHPMLTTRKASIRPIKQTYMEWMVRYRQHIQRSMV